jgi:hypothetical protein
MGEKSSRFLIGAVLHALLATGCGAQPPKVAPIGTVGATSQLFDPILVKPSVDADDVYDDDTTIDASSNDELIQFVRRRVERERGRLTQESEAKLMHPPRAGQGVLRQAPAGSGTQRGLRASHWPAPSRDRGSANQR